MGSFLRKCRVGNRLTNLKLTYRASQNDPHLGGACGEITTMIKKGKKLVNPLGNLIWEVGSCIHRLVDYIAFQLRLKTSNTR
jgi:hypothetical protein